MIHQIANYTENLWRQGRRIKQSQAGWLSGNAVCCNHNGHNSDTRGRGGLNVSGDGRITWHCFNCGFKTGYQPGRVLSFKFRKLLGWLGADQNEIQRLVFEALRVRDIVDPGIVAEPEEEIKFEKRKLPAEALSFLALVAFYELADQSYPQGMIDAVEYAYSRKIDLEKYEFFWSPAVEYKMSHRIIIPFKYQGEVIGYTARALVDGIKPKYYTDYPGHCVFNLDQQHRDNKFVIVCEGPFDAMSVDGVSVQSNDLSETQAELIEALGKQVIVVPDFDRHVNRQGKSVWPGEQIIKRAMEFGWSVSFPIWRETCKDVNDAVIKYGKLFVLKSILAATESNPLKIKLIANKI